MTAFIKILFTFISLGFGSCNLLKSNHYIILDHNISIKIEEEVHHFIEDLYQ